ncbi:MAG: prenyltransferase [Myxococcota bacterium]
MKLADVLPTHEVPVAPQVWLRTLHAFSFVAALASVFLGGALLHARGYHVELGGLALAALAAVLLSGALDLYDDADDLRRGLDRLGHTLDAAALARSEAAEHNLRRSAVACVVLAAFSLAPVFIPLALTRPALVMALFLVLFAGFTYVARPRRYKYVGLGDLPEAVAWGPGLTVLGMLAAAPIVTVRELLYSLLCAIPLAMMVGTVLLARDIRDREHDAVEGVSTLALRRGVEGAVRVMLLLVAGTAVSLGGLAALGLLPRASLISLAAVVLIIPVTQAVRRAYAERDVSKDQVVFRAEVMHALFAVLFIASLVWAQAATLEAGGKLQI